MKNNNVILDKTFQFGLRIVKLHLHLMKKKVERSLVIQVLRSGTSIGANVEEAMGGSSKKGFVQKLNVILCKLDFRIETQHSAYLVGMILNILN